MGQALHKKNRIVVYGISIGAFITVIRMIMFTLGTHMVRDVLFPLLHHYNHRGHFDLCIYYVDIFYSLMSSHDGWRSYLTSIYLWDNRYKKKSCVCVRYLPLGHLSQSLELSCSFWVLIWLEMYVPALHHLQSPRPF